MTAVKITPTIYWVGAVDWNMRHFHGHTYTTNGGTSWITKSTGYTNTFNEIAFSFGVGCIVGSGGLILRSPDEGNSWSPVSSGTIQNLNSIDFKKRDYVWACGDSGVIIKSDDKGAHWEFDNSGTTNNLRGNYSVCTCLF